MVLLQSVSHIDCTRLGLRGVCSTYSLYDAPISAWETILYFADHYDFAQIKDLAVRELQTKDISLVDRIILYHKYRVPQNYLIPLYEELCTHEIPPSVPEAIKLGLVAVVIIFQARERLRTNSLNDGKSPVPKDRQKDVHTTVQKLLAQLPPDSFPVGNCHDFTSLQPY